jgi:hypothetical protein
MLHHSGLVADGHDNVAFCELTHGISVSVYTLRLTG